MHIPIWRGFLLAVGMVWAGGWAVAGEAGEYGIVIEGGSSSMSAPGSIPGAVDLRSPPSYPVAAPPSAAPPVRLRSNRMEPLPAEEGMEAAEVLSSRLGNAKIAVGGEVNLDYYYKHRDAAPGYNYNLNFSQWTAATANLRLMAQAAEGMRLYLKLDLVPDRRYNQDTLLEECRFAFENIYGSSWSVVFGKGEAPYGQDRTLGVIQSYHHNADAATSKEGPILILYDDGLQPSLDAPGNYSHPGEIDRVYMLGVGWTWNDRVKIEAALFQKDRTAWGQRSADGPLGSMSARVWWLVNENWTLEASALRLQSRRDGDRPHHRDEGYAVSVGFDGGGECWDLFGEWEHSWDWNQTDGFHTDTFQLGGAWRWGGHWQIGAMAEWLRQRNPNLNDAREDWYRGVLSMKYRWDNGMFAILEYGHEWFRGRYRVGERVKAQGDLLAFRFGWMF